jgi:hypothetical protein
MSSKLKIKTSKMAIMQIGCGIALLIAVSYFSGSSLQFLFSYIPFQIAAGSYALTIAHGSSKRLLRRAEYAAFVGYTATYLVLISPIVLYMVYGGIFIAQQDLEVAMRCQSEEFRTGPSCSGVHLETLVKDPLNSLTQFSVYFAISLIGVISKAVFLLKFLVDRRSQTKARIANP